LKEPYELRQANFENFFCSYYVMMSYFLEQDRENGNTNLT
jgi:hypothetical protein